MPTLDASGINGRHGGPTKRGDALLREALFMAADQARRHEPTLAAKYHCLLVVAGKHHTLATCHIATTLLTGIVACWRAQTPDQLRETDGTTIGCSEALTIIADRYTVPEDLRRTRTTTTRTGRRSCRPGTAGRHRGSRSGAAARSTPVCVGSPSARHARADRRAWRSLR